MSYRTTVILGIALFLLASLATVDASSNNELLKKIQMTACGKRPEQKSLDELQVESLQGELEKFLGKKIYTNHDHKLIPVGEVLSDGFIVSSQFFPTSRNYKMYSGTILGGATVSTFIVTKTNGTTVLVGRYILGFDGLTLKNGKIFHEKIPTVVDVYYKTRSALSALPLVKSLATSFSRFFYGDGFGHIRHYEIRLYNMNKLQDCKSVGGKLTLKGCRYRVLVVNAMKKPCEW